MCMCVVMCLCGFVCMSKATRGSQKELGPLDLELHAIVNCLM